MRIGVAKPDHGIVGGFERVVDEVERGLTARGHTVERLVVPVRDLDRLPFGVRVAAATWRRNPEWFEHLRQVEAFLAVDASRFDVVLSTQPPSYAIRHPRHVSIFFHHLRRFYDLAGPIVDAGLVDRELHGHAARQIRRVDRPLLDRVGWFLAGSGAVAARLAEFNGIRDRVSVFHAGLGFRAGLPPEPGPPGTGAICVSRHEFPKRVELFVAAAHLASTRGWTAIGDGGRLGSTEALDRRYAAGEVDPAAAPEPTWWRDTEAPSAPGRVTFDGRVDAAALDARFRACRCVVAPALAEDYGLTALEAMAYARPVVVADDGGNLAELVEESGAGLVVAPTAAAIAAAVDRLQGDDDLAAELGGRGRAFAAGFTWTRAIDEVQAAIDRVTG